MKKIDHIIYISNYPVGYHHESLKYICEKIKINFQEIYISDFSHPVSGKQNVSKNSIYFKKNFKKNASFLNPFISFKNIFRKFN